MRPIYRSTDYWAKPVPKRHQTSMFVEWLIPTLLFWGMIALCILIGLQLVPEDTRTTKSDSSENPTTIQQGHPSLDRAWEEQKRRGEVPPATEYEYPIWPWMRALWGL